MLNLTRRIYLDYASLTPIDPRVLSEVKKYSKSEFANPSSIYKEGVAAKMAQEEARRRVAAFLNASPANVVFTSGGTEANGLAIEGVLRAARNSGIEKPHFIISAIEHSSVIRTAKKLESAGADVTYLPVNRSGIVDLDELKKAIRSSTVLVSIMTVNNEIGTIQPIREIAKIIRSARRKVKGENDQLPITNNQSPQYPLFHTDACQAALYHDLNVEKLGADLLTLDGAKVCGPRGIGCLYIKRGTPIEPIMHGGGQENGMRSGTENIPAIMGFAKALDIAAIDMAKETLRISVLKEYFVEQLRKMRPGVISNPDIPKAGGNSFSSIQKDDKNLVNFHKSLLSTASPHILNLSIPGIDNELFVLRLDAKGIAASTKSACLRDEDESYVLKAIGADSKTSFRFSFGRWTKKRDINKALNIIKDILANKRLSNKL